MEKSSTLVSDLLQVLESEAQVLGLSAAQWAERAGIRQETLSRLRRRQSCDLATIAALAQAVGFCLRVGPDTPANAPADALFPASFTRDAEDKLIEMCASGTRDPKTWARLGPPFFMAGLAVALASVPGFDRRALLELAEALHAGSSRVEDFALWLERSPLRPSRFLPVLMQRLRHAA
jgi:DNA-binding phage protein